jgi:hypothetical protein
MHNLSQT